MTRGTRVRGFVVVERFGPADSIWEDFKVTSGLEHLRELVSLDCSLCNYAIDCALQGYWDHVVEQELCLIDDLAWLLRVAPPSAAERLLFVSDDEDDSVDGFEFAGVDLVEEGGGHSALSNCGGWPDVFANDELNDVGLFSSWQKARATQQKLKEMYPTEPHAQTKAWALWTQKA